MSTIEAINSIKDKDFKDLLLYFNNIHNLDDKDFYKIMPDSFSKAEETIKHELASFLYRKLVNDKLRNAFMLSDNLKYKKQFEIIKNLLFKNDEDDYYGFFKSIIWTESQPSKYDELIWFIKSQGIIFSDELDTKISNFVNSDENRHAIYSPRSTYLSFEDEKDKLRNILLYEKGIIPIPVDYIRFKEEYIKTNPKECEGANEEFFISKYKALAIGHVGEYIVDERLKKNLLFPSFISKDIGDGFGYDSHHFNRKTNEEIVEVKSCLINSKDSFKLTQNEYRVLKDCMNLERSDYRIYRTYIDDRNLSLDNIVELIAEDENTLVPRNSNVNYKFVYTDDQDTSKVFTKQKR